MTDYNRTRSVEQLLEKTESSPPSFTVHLHPEYWVLNNGSKFLYHNQIASLLDDIRNYRIPVDFLELFDSARVPFYEGCMIVELLDYRPQKSKEPPLKNPTKSRVVLHPNPETLWADLCSLNKRHGGKWTDNDALGMESKLLLATSQPLCLDPDPHLTRIVNHVIRVSTPSIPLSLKRKATAMEPEEDGPEKAKRERFLSFMAPRDNRLHAPSYRLLDAAIAHKQRKATEASSASPANNQYMSTAPQPPQPAHPVPSHSQSPVVTRTPTPSMVQANSPIESIDRKPVKKKGDTPQMPAYNVAFTRSDGAHTPVPPRPTQFVNQHPPTTVGTSILQPQVYPNFHAATEAAKRAPTPSQQQIQPQQQQQQQFKHFALQQQPHQQQLQQPQQPQTQPRPPSQPQHPQPTAQMQQMQQQRFTQSPKPPPPQPISATQSHTQPPSQPYGGTPSQFQATIPTPHFLQQPPPGTRPGQKPQFPNGAQQQQAPSQPPTPAQLHLASSPSPARASPLVTHQQLQQAAAARSSPIPAKNQVPIQQGQPQQPQQLNQQQQLAQQQQQQHSATAQNMQMHQPRVAFQQYNPSHLRPVVHPNQGHMMGANSAQGTASNRTPTLASASPRLSGDGRPITPATGVQEVKVQQQQMGGMQIPIQPQQLPLRRPTPMQQQQMQQQRMQTAASQLLAIQAQQAQAQVQQHLQQATQQAQPSQTQTPVQQSAQTGGQQIPHYPQMYQQYPSLWRGLPQNLTQQQQQVQLHMLQQRMQQAQVAQQQQQGVTGGQAIMGNNGQQPQGMMINGQQLTPQQTMQLAAKAHQAQQQQQAAAQRMMMATGGQQAMMGKMQTQQAQVQAQAQAQAKGKSMAKKGVAKKTPGGR